MLFSLRFNRPLIVNPVLNEYIKNSNDKYIKSIIKNIEYKNQHKKIFGEQVINEETSIIIPSVFLLSLTTIIYYFYSIRN
jgi:hypothetical protein